MTQRQMHREVFLAHNGPGPWPCFRCGKPVYFQDKFVVHHHNENFEDDQPDNLAAGHPRCHIGYHHTGPQPYYAHLKARGKKHTDAWKRKIGRGVRRAQALWSTAKKIKIARHGWRTRRRRYGPSGMGGG